MKAAFLTAIYDNYDELKEIKPQPYVHEAICVTDNPDLTSDTWDVRYEPRDGHPNRAAKHPKCCPWDYTDADVTVWIDASFRIISHDFLEAMFDYLPWGQFQHWERDCLYSEAEVSAQMGKYAGEPLQAQAAHYEKAMPPHWGLWATGLIVRERSATIECAGRAWLDEIDRWTFQDQVSQPYVLWKFGIRPRIIPGTYGQNGWVQYAGSARH